MPVDHTSLAVPLSKVELEVAFFLAAYAHMGFKDAIRPVPGVVGLGDETGCFLWISGFDSKFNPISDDAHIFRTHLALSAKDRTQVDTFYAEGLKAGGKDNGKPGLRVEYHPNYYGAFLISPGGHNIEAVTHTPPPNAQ
ncbi:lactoylglutathione lyase [Exophiala aquamarina CBS 119918]|uniref:Lactoylglutathione lyase n=1 Tax=Exophiala aquamarina CBS 119918 TaxID=1182545 RepID=A0A072PFG1_9EURO|nr:lactoylglutathione lyase [Exophiala aquamarina CBS 119918]KEF58512.1 lactoylglutathione lyase [Exophiala aquamarina CBS 119918]